MTTQEKIKELIDQFVQTGIARSDAWRHLDVNSYNKLVKKTITIVEKLKELSPHWRQLLHPLIQNADPYVRLSSAYYCLDIDRGQAIATLRGLERTIACDHASAILWDIEHARL
jgi:hypothetical protein